MNIIELKQRSGTEDIKLNRIFDQFAALLAEVRKKELPQIISEAINQDILEINASLLDRNDLRKLIKKKQSNILKLLESKLKIVPKNHYRNTWLALGMAAFGLPFGLLFGKMMGNQGLLAVGLPIGMVIGMSIGAGMDKKALTDGKQLDIEIKY